VHLNPSNDETPHGHWPLGATNNSFDAPLGIHLMHLHTTHRARNRRGVAAGEWTAMIVVFILGTGLGLWATGGLDMPQARASLIDIAQRTGVDLQPFLGTISNPVGADLRQVVATSQDGEIATATEEKEALDEPPVDASALRSLVAAAHESSNNDETRSPKRNKQAKRKTVTKGDSADGAATLAYWNGLNAIMSQEVGMRRTPGKVTSDNANDFVDSLASANTFAAKSIRELDTQHVDADALHLGQEIADWYEEGASLNGEATFLLNEADPNTRRGAQGKSWEKSEHAHQKRCEEINRHGAALRKKLSQKYGLDFPELK